MRVSVVITISGKDSPGIVESIARVVAAHEGNWDEAKMARLAGRFTGVVTATVPEARLPSLRADLTELGGSGLNVIVEPADAGGDRFADYQRMVFDLTGTDREGIVKEVTAVFLAHGVNVEEIITRRREVPMGGGLLFEITAELLCPPTTLIDDLRGGLESLSSELTVDITRRPDKPADSG